MIVLIYIFLLLENILEKYIPFLKYTDELIAIFSIFGIFLMDTKIVVNRYEKRTINSVLLIILIGFAGNIRFGYQNSVIAIAKDILAIGKFFSVYLFCTIRFKRGIPIRKLEQIETISRIYCFVLAAFAIASQFINLGMTNARSIFGLKAFVFLYSHETFLVSSTVILLSTLISCGVKRNRCAIFAGGIVLFMAMRSKAIVFAAMFIGMSLFFYKRNSIENFIKKNKAKMAGGLILICGIILYFTQDKIETYIKYGLTAARPALYIVSLQILRDAFPIGSGFATFASHLSTTYGSPLYELYGIAGVSGLTRLDNYAYVSDTYWPYILAQLGLIGTILYIYSLMCVFKNTVRICSRKKDTLIASVSMFAYVIAACFVESYLTNATVVLFAITLGLIMNQQMENA